MKKDVNELKKLFFDIIQNPSLVNHPNSYPHDQVLNEYHQNGDQRPVQSQPVILNGSNEIQHPVEVEESLSIMDKEKELIIKALKKHRGKRKDAASDLGISERTLYRKLKEYDIDE